MSKKKAFALRVNEDILKAIEKWASGEFRSTNGQIEWMLTQSLSKQNECKRKAIKNNFNTKKAFQKVRNAFFKLTNQKNKMTLKKVIYSLIFKHCAKN